MPIGPVRILNGFGISLGDSIIGLQALYAARALGVIDSRPVLLRRTDVRPMVAEIYRVAADMADVEPLPARPEEMDWSGTVIDMRDFAFDPAFRGVAMIDYFLRHLRLEPDRVPAALKRNLWLAPRARLKHPAGLPDRYVLVCPNTSMAIRDMPDAIHVHILRRLAARAGLPIVTQGTPPDDGPGVIQAPDCAGIETLLGLAAGSALVVSTDTAMVHLADAFDIPCLAFFPTHRPEWRVRDYPRCWPIHLPAPGLPEALEFARDDSDIAAAQAAWFPNGNDLAWLDTAIDDVITRI